MNGIALLNSKNGFVGERVASVLRRYSYPRTYRNICAGYPVVATLLSHVIHYSVRSVM